MTICALKKFLTTTFTLFCLNLLAAAWQPAASPLMTRWGKEVAPDNAWREYPRPQLERAAWQNLNGLWSYAVSKTNAAAPDPSGKILVPFGVESALSGVGRLLEPDEILTYARHFKLKAPAGHRVLLHFEAVDYDATVWVNNQPVGAHRGGNTPFVLDITDAVQRGDNVLKVRVTDATDAPGSFQLHGKQKLLAGGIWYTRVSGIWQTVWLEEVPGSYLADLRITTRCNPAKIIIEPELAGDNAAVKAVRVAAYFNGRRVAEVAGDSSRVELAIPDAKLWSPAHPNLYDLKITLLDAGGKVLDTVKSYAGIREVGTVRDADGNLRFTLNGEIIFHWGPLDQGWWPDGLLTPPSDEAMAWDIQFLKDAGFNMIRKHIKVEPRRYYYHCDQIGMMVWQDQPSGGSSPKWTRLNPNPVDAVWPDGAHEQYLAEFREMVKDLRNSPAVVAWEPFNEAWGQHRSIEVGQAVMSWDPTRLVNLASGGNFWPVGQIADGHNYPSPAFPLGDERFKDYVKVVGEFGGHGLAVPGHLWVTDAAKLRSYGKLPQTRDEWQARYEKTLGELAALKAQGVAGGIYTQTTDVEGEINGLLTYDRAVEKAPRAELRKLSRCLGGEILK